MNKRIAIVYGSGRSNGDTARVCKEVAEEMGAAVHDVTDYVREPYAYRQGADDFLILMQKLLDTADVIVLASPVYWYSVSAQMKGFIDRWTELLKEHKDLGRQMRGRGLALLSRSHDDDCPEEYAMPIRRTADYMGMHWLGHLHCHDDGPSDEAKSAFVQACKKGG